MLKALSVPALSEQEATASPLFNMRADLLASFLNRGHRRSYPAGTAIYRADETPDELFYLHQGQVKQFILTPNGVEKVIGWANPGCLFGEALFLNRCPAQTTAIAVEDSVVCAFSRGTMEHLFRTQPELLAEVARSLSFKVRLLTSQIWIMASNDSASRVGKVLYLLARERPEPNPTIHLTHQGLADLAGVHRVTVSDFLADLSRERVLECKRGRIVVKKPERLLKYRSG
jgi:CRP-like cAMP-binding protein